MKLYFCDLDCGPAGSLHGVFVVNDKGYTDLVRMLETPVEIYFGEVLGKHSSVSGTINPDELTLVTEDESVIAIVMDNAKSWSSVPWRARLEACGTTTALGYNPVACMLEAEAEEAAEEAAETEAERAAEAENL